MDASTTNFKAMTETAPPPKRIAAGICEPCSWRHGRGPVTESPPMVSGRCDLCRSQKLVMPMAFAELEPVALEWVGTVD